MPKRHEDPGKDAQSTTRTFLSAGDALLARQETAGPNRGNVPAWTGATDPDFHGTLAAIWVWTRAEARSREFRFRPAMVAGWAFVRSSWTRFVPGALGPAASDEAAYDCAMVLRAAMGAHAIGALDEAVDAPACAARLLSAYLTDLDDFSGRDFRDPGFLAWNLAEHARLVEDRGLIAASRRFVDRAFGMKLPPPFASEPQVRDGLFDFSSTTATRVLAVLAAEGNTPFVGAWLRERVGPHVPNGFLPRVLDENCWNALVATALGRAYRASTGPVFLVGNVAILEELERRSGGKAAIGRQLGFADETNATFFRCLALDALGPTP